MRFCLSVLAFVVFSSAVAAQSQDRMEVQEVIRKQFEAFQIKDMAGAFALASPDIRSVFGSADVFGRMVEMGYPMVWNNARIQFPTTTQSADVLWQRVIVTDQSGALHVLDYQMIPFDGGWKINGVRLVPAPDVGA